MNNISRKINFQNLNNTRDLGGIKTMEGGIIKPERLIRSGQLYFASPEDIQLFVKMGLKKIYDFRSNEEKTDKPDPEIPGVENIHMPIVKELTPGISREKNADKKSIDLILQNSVKNPNYGIEYMANTYKTFVTDEYAISRYAFFMNQLTESKDGASLWHCTAGKDRAGFGTVLVLEALGVHQDDIFEDYLATNDHLSGEIDMLIEMLTHKPGLETAEAPIRDFFSAKEQYLAANYKILQEQYGGAGNFLTEQLNVNIEEFRNNYLN